MRQGQPNPWTDGARHRREGVAPCRLLNSSPFRIDGVQRGSRLEARQ